MGVVASSTHQAPSPGFLAGGRPGAHFSVLPCAPRTARLVECHCQWQCAPAVPFVVCRLCGGAPVHLSLTTATRFVCTWWRIWPASRRRRRSVQCRNWVPPPHPPPPPRPVGSVVGPVLRFCFLIVEKSFSNGPLPLSSRDAAPSASLTKQLPQPTSAELRLQNCADECIAHPRCRNACLVA